MADRLRRMTDLFQRGQMVILRPCEYNDAGQVTEEGVYLWVQKLNSFERAEAQRDGMAAQSARFLTLGEDSDYVRALRQELEGYDLAPIVEAVVQKFQEECLVLAGQDVRAMEEWRDQILLIERLEVLGDEMTDEERQAAEALNLKYLDAVQEAALARLMEKREEFKGLPRDQIEDEYIEQNRKMRGSAAFQEGYTLTEMYYAIRDCNAVETSPHSTEFDHKKCTHRKLADNRQQVRELDDSILFLVRDAIQQLNMSPENVGNSVAPSISSKS